jgi:quinol monooxygenase YgiN
LVRALETSLAASRKVKDMSDEISWHVELAVKPNQLTAFRELTAEMVAATHAERGVLSYRRFVSDDGTVVYVHERYVDSDAAVVHLEDFSARFGERYATLVERRRFIVFGDPGPTLKRHLERYDVAYEKPLGDLAYW